MNLGGGTLDAQAKIVAEELKVPLDRVGISPVDTRTTVYDVCTHANRGIYCGGGALHKVTGQAKTKLLEFASRILQVPPHSLKMELDEEAGQGMVYVDGVQGERISVGEVAKTAQINDWGTIAAVDSLRQVSSPPCFMAYFIEVEVNTETGVIKPTKAVTSLQIKTMGTLGGNLCHGSPAADSAPPLIAFGARVKMIGGGQERTIPLETFFTGPGETLLTREELMVEIQIPEPKAKTGSAFIKLGRVPPIWPKSVRQW